MKAFVLAEHSNAARSLAAGARSMADEVVLIAIASLEVADATADRIAHITLPSGAVYDDAADTVVSVFDFERPDMVLAEPTRRMKSIVGKVAAHVGASVVTDVVELSAKGARSLYFGGVAERIQKPTTDVAFYTVPPSVFEGLEPSGENETKELAWIAPAVPLELVNSMPVEKSGVDLTKADVVVAVGRGFSEEGQLDLARGLCEKIDAGLGCSRPLTEGVDWLPSELYIGVSGQTVTPKAYIAVGISGQMQHMVGCNRSGTIFAINKDKNAPVFQQCDYGIVGDLKDVLPALIAAL